MLMQITKVCFKCGVEKPLSEYYKHSKMTDGHLNKCKECAKADVKNNRAENIDYYQHYDRNRDNKQERNDKYREYVKTRCKEDEEFALTRRSYSRKWITENPMKRKAQITASNAVRDGRLGRKYSCEHCGCTDKPLHKHHWSYEKEHWLDVLWLCVKCHIAEHVRLRALERDPDNKENQMNASS